MRLNHGILQYDDMHTHSLYELLAQQRLFTVVAGAAGQWGMWSRPDLPGANVYTIAYFWAKLSVAQRLLTSAAHLAGLASLACEFGGVTMGSGQSIQAVRSGVPFQNFHEINSKIIINRRLDQVYLSCACTYSSY